MNATTVAVDLAKSVFQFAVAVPRGRWSNRAAYVRRNKTGDHGF